MQCVKDDVTSQFTYGADGLRRRSLVTDAAGEVTQTDYVLDGQSVVQEIVRRAASIDELGTAPAETITYLQGPSGPLYRKSSNAADPVWYVYDGLGSVVGEVNVAGQFTASRRFDVYGFVRGSSGASTSRHKFVGGLGHQSDDETGLIYMRARYYDPAVGRFVSEDPAGDGENWFVYCGNDPVNRFDPDGRAWLTGDCISWLLALTGNEGNAAAKLALEAGEEATLKWLRKELAKAEADLLLGGGRGAAGAVEMRTAQAFDNDAWEAQAARKTINGGYQDIYAAVKVHALQLMINIVENEKGSVGPLF